MSKIVKETESMVEQVKKSLQLRKDIKIFEIDGCQCKTLSDYFSIASKTIKFPIPSKSWDGYDDWMRDFTWFDSKNICIFIYNYALFLREEPNKKAAVIEDFYEIIFPWWDKEVMQYMVGGQTKNIDVYLID